MSSPEYLPFQDPAVQAWLRESTQIVFSTGLISKIVTERNRLLARRNEPNFRPPQSDAEVVASMWQSLGAEVPIVAMRGIGTYETVEEAQYLVKVDSVGHVLTGSLTQVAILDHERRSPLLRTEEFTADDLETVQMMLDRQDALPWHPELNKD